MEEQSYLMLNQSTNTVDNDIVWNGDTNIWQPPSGYTMLQNATIPSMIWQLNSNKTDFVLTEVYGAGSVGFTWNGTVLTTNDPKPKAPIQQA
jgi:hypothetical protein